MPPLAVSDPVALGLAGLLFAPVEIPIVYYCTCRAIRSWRRWTS